MRASRSFQQRAPRQRHARHAGQVMVLAALFTFVLIGATALSIDGGFILAERRQVQSAADAAALAAAQAMVSNATTSVIVASAQTYGTLNAGTGSTVAVSRPPATGPYAGNNRYVEVTVTKPVQRFFVGAVYPGSWQVQARAVAGIESLPLRPHALLALQAPGISINGSTSIYISGNGHIMSNSNITGGGGANTVFTGGTIHASGTIQSGANWTAGQGFQSGVDQVQDPLAGTPAPPPGTARTAPSCNTTCTFQPGHYNNLGTITIQGTATFAPGIYYFNGNTRVQLQNTNSTIQGSNVLLYFTGSSSIAPNNGNINISALTSGPAYSGGVTGMLLWIANCSSFDSSGNGVFRVEGVIYAPCSAVSLHGTPDSNGLQVIVGSLQLTGNSSFNVLYREYVVTRLPKIRLVE
jgi:Flp pilus assembly protein TadG